MNIKKPQSMAYNTKKHYNVFMNKQNKTFVQKQVHLKIKSDLG